MSNAALGLWTLFWLTFAVLIAIAVFAVVVA